MKIKLIKSQNEYTPQDTHIPVECVIGKTSLVHRKLKGTPTPLDHHNEYQHLPSACEQAMDIVLLTPHEYNTLCDTTANTYVSVAGSIDADVIMAIAILTNNKPLSNKAQHLIAQVGKADRNVTLDQEEIVPHFYLIRQTIGKARLAIAKVNGELAIIGGVTEEELWQCTIEQVQHLLNNMDDYDIYAKRAKEKHLAEEKQRGIDANDVTYTLSSKGFAVRVTDIRATDIWYESHSKLACYSPKLKKAVICTNDSTVDLLSLRLPKGWGGRSSIVGSPRDKELTLREFDRIVKKIL